MGIAAGLAAAGAAASLGNTISGAVSGGGSASGGFGTGVNIPGGYTPMFQPQADLSYWNLAQDMAGLSQQGGPFVQNTIANPYAASQQWGANAAEAYGLGSSLTPFLPPNNGPGYLIPGVYGSGPITSNTIASGVPGASAPVMGPNGIMMSGANNNAYGSPSEGGASGGGGFGMQGSGLFPMQAQGASNLYGAAGNILNTAFDPQQTLYNRTLQQTVDQSNATNAMYGLGSSPYGAGVAGNNLNNFNIDWQNAQLQRQLQGVQGAGQGYAGASDLGTAAQQTLIGSTQSPYQTYAGNQGTSLNALTAGQGLDANTLNALAAYLRLGQSATGLGLQGAGLGLQAQNQGFNQQQTQGQNLATSLSNPALSSALSNLFGGGGGGGLFTNSNLDPTSAAMDAFGSGGF